MHLKNMQGRAYVSDRLKKSLGSFEMHRYNFVCAPSGYGKSAACRTLLKSRPGYTVLWIDADSSKTSFFNNLCNALKIVSPLTAAMLHNVGFPDTSEKVETVIDILLSQDTDSAPQQTGLIVIDNFDTILDDNIVRIIAASNASHAAGVRYVFLVRRIYSQKINALISKELIGIADSDMLAFSESDIQGYFKLNEISVDRRTLHRIYVNSHGWPYIVKLYADAYISDNEIDYDEVGIKTDTFIYNNIWLELDSRLRKFFTNMCVFNGFSLSQCVNQMGATEKECLDCINATSLIRLDGKLRLFVVNPVFNAFLFRNAGAMAEADIRDIAQRAEETYISCGNYFEAMRLCCISKNYSALYECEPQFKDIYPHVIRKNKDIFAEIAGHYWDADKRGKYIFSIIMCFSMLLLNERNMAGTLLGDIETDIKMDGCIRDDEKIYYYAELEYIKAFTEYNNFAKMIKHFKRVTGLTKTPVAMIAGGFPFGFDCPSIVSLYYRKPGTLDECIDAADECAPAYYRTSNGHGKGFEALIKAGALYERGDTEGAEILCHKAVYMADSRNQYSILMSAYYRLALIAICHGSYDELNEYIGNINRIIDKHGSSFQSLARMADICKAGIYICAGEDEKAQNWLMDEKDIEDNVNFFSLGYVNILFGRRLIDTRQYHHFLGISGQMLGLSRVFSYVLPDIYTYIYLSVANAETGDMQKAGTFMTEAVKLAEADKIYMPFVHNFEYISERLSDITVGGQHTAFVKNVIRLARAYEKGVKTIKKAGNKVSGYGLTARETDVAKLAAQRLSNKEIAQQLFIAESTVKSNMKVIFNKLQISSRSELKNFFQR